MFHPRRTAHQNSSLIFGSAAAIMLSLASSARAFSIVGQLSSAPAGGTGSFEVDCIGDSSPSDLDGFSFQITVPTGITITSANTDTADPYIFGSLQTPPFVQSTTSDSVTVGDSTSGSTTVVAPDAFGLAQFNYSVAPGTSPGYYFVSYPSLTFDFSDDVIGSFAISPYTLIQVTAVPEPLTLTMLPLAGITLLSRRGRRA